MSRLSVSFLANKTKRIPAGACTPPKRASKRSTRRYQRANAAIMHAHVRYSRVLHYRQGSKLRGRTYTLVHVTYLDVLYPVPVRTRSYRNVRTRVRSVRAHVRSPQVRAANEAELGRNRPNAWKPVVALLARCDVESVPRQSSSGIGQ